MPLNEAFIDACYDGDLQAVLEAIAKQSLTSEDLQEGLQGATYDGHPEIVAALFEAGATITPSILECLPGEHCQQDPLVIRHYLDRGLDPNARDRNGEPFLRLMGTAACTREMLSRGADPNLTGPTGVSPLRSAIISCEEPNTERVELLVEYGAKLSPDLFFSAVAPRVREQERKTRWLIDKGLDPNTTSPEWGTPLHLAVRAAKPNVVKTLLDAGADPAARSIGVKNLDDTPTDVAERIMFEKPRQEILDLLRAYARE